jgi:hypothetical protein
MRRPSSCVKRVGKKGEIMPNNTASKRAKQHSASAKENGKVKSYPPPKQLATPSDLKPEEVEPVTGNS